MALEDKPTADGYDIQMQTNHLSHFLLVRELFPLLEKASELRDQARIVHHSSGARMFPSSALDARYLGKNGGNLGGNGASMLFGGARWQRYHQTKLANVVFTLALADRLKSKFGSKIIAAVAAPGLAATNLQVTTHGDGGFADTWIMRYAQSAEDGAMPIIKCCMAAEVSQGDLWEPGMITGPPVKKAPEAICRNPASRRILWEESEKACGAWDL